MTKLPKIRILCDGWYNSETNIGYSRGTILSGDQITPRVLEALTSQETYVDQNGNASPVCEEVITGLDKLPSLDTRFPGSRRIPIPGDGLSVPDIERTAHEVAPIRILEARMSVSGIKIVDLGDIKIGIEKEGGDNDGK